MKQCDGRNTDMEETGEFQRYADMLKLSRPVVPGHPPMAAADRAAQFSPFSALSGYGAAVEETGRRTEKYTEPDEASREELNAKILFLRGKLALRPLITATYFEPDRRKEGGEYVTFRGKIKKIDGYRRMLIMEDGTEIRMEMLTELAGDVFDVSR